MGRLVVAHTAAAQNPSCSTINAINAFHGSDDIGNAVCAAIMGIGGRHAPVVEIYDTIVSDNPAELVSSIIATGGKVPGFGNSFETEPGELWVAVRNQLAVVSPMVAERVMLLTEAVHFHGLKIFPNPGCYTAACAIALGMPRVVAPLLFIESRLWAWAEICTRTK